MIHSQGRERSSWYVDDLFLVAGEGVRDSLASAAEAVLDGAEHALSLLGGVVATGASGITDLLSSGLLALRLNGSGDAVTSSSQGLAGLVESRLLGVGGDLLLCLLAETLAHVVRHVD